MVKLKKLIVNIITVSIACVVALGICEITIRMFYGKLKNYNMEMWRYSSELKKPLWDKTLPFIHEPNKDGNYYGVNIATNSLGFRDVEFDVKKEDEEYRILVLGDSHTLGWGVPFDSTYCRVLNKLLKDSISDNFRVINTGVGNYNTAMELEIYKRKGITLEPDMVILMYVINDAEETPTISRWRYKLGKSLYLFAFAFDKLQKIKVSFFTQKYNWKKFDLDLYKPGFSGYTKAFNSIHELANSCKNRNTDLLICCLPELHNLKEYPFIRINQEIKNLAIEKDIEYLDLLEPLKPIDEEFLWVSPEDAHSNSMAHRIMAKSIYEKLKTQFLMKYE